MRIKDIIEDATSGATSSGNIATIVNPHLSPGKARGMKSYTGSPGKSGTKAPPQPKPKMQKPGANALDMKGVSIFGAPIKRVSENKHTIKENISRKTTIKSIIDELNSIRKLYISLRPIADNWFNKFGMLENGFYRNAIARSPNKLQALQLELNKRDIDLNKPKSENVQWYSADDNVEQITEDLKKWFREKWVRFGPDGKIRGACARGSESEGKPKCLPQAKARALGKKGRKYAASKKRREDPDPERRGPAKNVATRKKSNEGVVEGNINEIDHASELDSSAAAPNKLMRSGQVIGNIEGNDVIMVSRGSQTVYILKIDDRATAFVGFEGNNLKNIKNFTNTPGAIRALIGYLVHKKNMQLVISPDEPLTLSGLKWIIRLINEPRGLVIKDHAGQDIDPKKLQQEWKTARKTGTPRPTGITISENIQFGRKLRANESKRDANSLLMPFNFYSIKPTPQGAAEDVDVDAIHAQALREHLLTNPKLYENQQDVIEIREFLKLHATPAPRVGKEYAYASVQVTPLANFVHIAHFNNEHPLVKLSQDRAYFKIDKTIKKFPLFGSLSGDALSKIYFFDSRREFQKFITLLLLKYSNYKITYKVLDQGDMTENQLDELKCWPGYTRVQGVPAGASGSCKKKTSELKDRCPHCGGELVSEEMINEKKDACYYKVKSRYKVWPSAYASGALIQCRKKGTKNWGSKK